MFAKGGDSLRFNEKIRAIRMKSLLTQADFAKELGVSFSTVNRWENGKAIPKIFTLKLIYKFCIDHGIPFDIEDPRPIEKDQIGGTE